MPATCAGVPTLNGPRSRLSTSTTAAGPYSQPSRSAASAEQLGEGAGHHHVVGAIDQLDAGAVVVRADVLGIGGVDHQEHVVRQTRVQTRQLVGGRDSCRSGCWGWR